MLDKLHARKPVPSPAYWITSSLILLYPIILRLPFAFGHRYDVPVRAFVLLPILAGLGYQLWVIKKNDISIRYEIRGMRLVLGFFLLWLVAYVRTALRYDVLGRIFLFLDVLGVILFCSLVFLCFQISPSGGDRRVRRFVVLSFAGYVLSNLILNQLGIHPNDRIFLAEYPRQLLAFIGLPGPRVFFPMSNGMNDYGSLAAIVMVGSLLLVTIRSSWPFRIAGLGVACFALVTILLVDSRGALLASFASIGMVIFMGKWPRILFPIAVGFSLSPILFAPFLESYSLSHLEVLMRAPSSFSEDSQPQSEADPCEDMLKNSTGALSNRTIVWRIALAEISAPKPVHLFGYGYRGQVDSGLAMQYACLFKSYAISNRASLHQVWLQLWIDLGYLGLFVMVVILYSTAIRFGDSYAVTADDTYRSLMGMLICVILIGMLEPALSPDYNEVFMLICVILVAGISPSGDASSR